MNIECVFNKMFFIQKKKVFLSNNVPELLFQWTTKEEIIYSNSVENPFFYK